MLKKIIAGTMAVGILAASTVALACGCGEQYRTYEYNYKGNSTHDVAYSCSNPRCENPFTIVGVDECIPYEYYYDQFDNVSHYWCDVCGGILPSVYH